MQAGALPILPICCRSVAACMSAAATSPATTSSDANASGDQGKPHYAAIARSVTRGLALYFSRPVRLFRPAKVSAWLFLQRLASHQGTSLSPKFISSLVKEHGFLVIPRHFLPPLVVNAGLGMVLWASYAETSSMLDIQMPMHPTMNAALSGAVAGGAQAIVAAPAENVRLLLEGSSYTRWSGAWKDVFLGATPHHGRRSKVEARREARQIRAWMKDVGDMAGRGWNGWGWGCAKDVCGFATFFAIFDVTRRSAANVKTAATQMLAVDPSIDKTYKNHVPRVLHGVWLVSGGAFAGLIYEYIGRPFDTARRTVELHRLETQSKPKTDRAISIVRVLTDKARTEGLVSFFRLAGQTDAEALHNRSTKLTTLLRTLGRVGPWGIGFLVWEAFGPGITS